jgi:hypothetical protein
MRKQVCEPPSVILQSEKVCQCSVDASATHVIAIDTSMIALSLVSEKELPVWYVPGTPIFAVQSLLCPLHQSGKSKRHVEVHFLFG